MIEPLLIVRGPVMDETERRRLLAALPSTVVLPGEAQLEFVAPRLRLMRGQVVVRELDAATDALWTPEPSARQVKTHRGVVLGMGPPARLTEHPDSPEVPHGFGVGAVVQYHFGAMGTQAARTRAWLDGEPATWLTQAEIDAVWEEESTGLTFTFGPGVLVEGPEPPAVLAQLATLEEALDA
jgi:hypothetical protein